MVTKGQIASGVIQVASGLIRPDRFLRWLRAHTPPDRDLAGDVPLARQLALLKFWFEMEERGVVSEAWLRRQLGYWLQGHVSAELMGLEFQSDRP